MLICKVIGNVVATKQEEKYRGQKLMIIQPITIDGEPRGKSFQAIDTVQAGAGDTVLVTVQGSSARAALHDNDIAADSVIIAVIDNIELD